MRQASYTWRGEKQEPITKQLELLAEDSQIDNLEALIFGFWDYWASHIIVDPLFELSEKLPHLKALFIGDIQDEEMMISSIELSDMGMILGIYPNLDLLHIRGGRGLRFSSGLCDRHNNLKAIRIESGGLPREAINDLCALELPALEYLELWMGTPEYGGYSTIEDLMPIVQGKAFPNLKYLGLRNAEYTDEIVFELVKSPLINHLIELDLSLGTLGIEGAEALLNCPGINELDTLNISKNWLDNFLEILNQLIQLDCNIIANEQEWYDPNEKDEDEERYCSVRE